MPATILGYMDLAILAVFVFAICLAALEDVRVFKIPNWASATIALAFIPYYLLHSWLFPIGMHLLIAAAIFVITATFWKFRFIGGGDVKLLTAVGLWLGPDLALPFTMLMTGASVVIAVVLLLVRHWSWVFQAAAAPRPVLRVLAIADSGKCPYALPIAIAALLTVPERFL